TAKDSCAVIIKFTSALWRSLSSAGLKIITSESTQGRAITLSVPVADSPHFFPQASALGGSIASQKYTRGKGRISPSTLWVRWALPIDLATAFRVRSVYFINTFLTPA